MQSKAATITAYLRSLPADQRKVIATLDRLIKSTVPQATGGMKYGMPAYTINGRLFAGLNAQKHYYSFYADPGVVARHRQELAGLDCGKSCIRFRKLESLPLDTIRRIVIESATAQPA